MKTILQILALLGGLFSAGLYAPDIPSYTYLLWPVRVLASALSPFLAVLNFGLAALGLARRDRFLTLAGGLGGLLAALHLRQVTRAPADFERAFGPGWRERIPPALRERMLPRPWSPRMLGRPAPWTELPPPGRANVPFWTLADGQALLCDVWFPPPATPRSGLTFLFHHASAWCLIAKDFATRPFFRHLTAQGHVVIDVNYRLCPQTGIFGMLDDVRRGIAWVKQNADHLGVDPHKLVAAGASAGGQLALLAAYTAGNPAGPPLPDDLAGRDLSVRGVVSYYGPPDLVHLHHNVRTLVELVQPLVNRLGLVKPVAWLIAGGLRLLTGQRYAPLVSEFERTIRDVGLLDRLVGGRPDEVPERYALASPASFVSARVPPTLLVEGSKDSLVGVYATRRFYHSLRAAGARVVYLELPQAEHAFDLVLSTLSPAMHVALYHLDRFLGLMASATDFKQSGDQNAALNQETHPDQERVPPVL